MAAQRYVFLYELGGKLVKGAISQTECGKYIGCTETAIRKGKDTYRPIHKNFYVFSSKNLAESFFNFQDAIEDYEYPLEVKNTNVLNDRLNDLGYDKGSVTSVKTWQNHAGETRFSIITRPDQVNVEDFLEKLKETLTEEIPVYSNPFKDFSSKEVGEIADLIVYTSDKHVGCDTNGSQYNNKYDSEEFNRRMKLLYAEIMYIASCYGKIGKLIFIDLGDNLDGYNKQTTRGGHTLPQNMNDVEAFNTYVSSHMQLFDSLIVNNAAMEYEFICVNDSNHSGNFGYTANRALEIYLNAKYPFVETRLMTKFMEHFIFGNEAYILCHGKDSTDMKTGLPYHLNDRTYKLISDYIDYNNLNEFERIHFIKGDLHQDGFERTSKFDYRNIPSIFGASKWIMNNFGINKPGFTMDVLYKGNCYTYHYEYEI